MTKVTSADVATFMFDFEGCEKRIVGTVDHITFEFPEWFECETCKGTGIIELDRPLYAGMITQDCCDHCQGSGQTKSLYRSGYVRNVYPAKEINLLEGEISVELKMSPCPGNIFGFHGDPDNTGQCIYCGSET